MDVVSADPTSDGGDVWGIQEHYKMDYSKPPGRESTLVGYSLNRHKYPMDPRRLTFVKQNGERGLTSPKVVYINGRRFLFVGGMFASNFINIFRYDGEIAVPSGLILQWRNGLYRTEQKWPPNKPTGKTSIWRDLNGDGEYQADEFAPNTDLIQPGPFWVDKKGNIWMAYGFFRYDCQGLDAKGNPIYSADKITVVDPPKGVSKVARVVYLDDRAAGFRTGNLDSSSKRRCWPAPRQPPRRASRNIWAAVWLEVLALYMPRSSWTDLARDFSTARLEDVDGIGPKRRKRIKEAWAEREIMVFLHSDGVSTSRAVRIYRSTARMPSKRPEPTRTS